MNNLQIAFAIIDLGLRLINEIEKSVQLDPSDKQAVKDRIKEIQNKIKTLDGKPVSERIKEIT